MDFKKESPSFQDEFEDVNQRDTAKADQRTSVKMENRNSVKETSDLQVKAMRGRYRSYCSMKCEAEIDTNFGDGQQKQNGKHRLRRPSFMELETNQKVIVDKMIRQDAKITNCLEVVMEEDETCLCSSDIYIKENKNWKNRQMINLTTKKLHIYAVEDITKIKIKNERPMDGYFLFKCTLKPDTLCEMAVREVDLQAWFSSIIWIHLVVNGFQTRLNEDFDGFFEGEILKKSEFFGKWEKRHVEIHQDEGLISTHKKSQTPSLRIKNTNEIWSRFEIIENKSYLVLKLWYLMFKEEFAIPINEAVKWAKAFTSLIK